MFAEHCACDKLSLSCLSTSACFFLSTHTHANTPPPRSLQQRPATPVPSFFWAAGFSFAPSSWLLQVPYCPHLPHLFFGEEQAMLLRMWTRGWDVYAPTQPLAFHQWERSARGNSYQACVQVGTRHVCE